jgi:hypothetical protein
MTTTSEHSAPTGQHHISEKWPISTEDASANPSQPDHNTHLHTSRDGSDATPQTQDNAPTNSNDEKPKAAADDDQPAGGYDDTPIPKRPAGYTLKFTFHNAANLPIGDVNTFASDPFVLAQLNTDVPTRHKEDPYLRYRTKTIQKDTAPVWEDDWIVANVPSTGFKLKLHVYDEDPADSDDLLGGVHITVPSLDDHWEGLHREIYKIKTHGGSWRAYTLQALTTCMRADKSLRGDLTVSIEMLGRTEEDGQNGRLYTVGPCRWIRHYSPILGRLVNTTGAQAHQQAKAQQSDAPSPEQKQVKQYNFQANQIQLQGPVPAELYHRYVEFKPWVKRMFTSSGLSGIILGKALHHQHSRVYNFGRSTDRGTLPEGKPTEELTKRFLDLVHYDEGGRIFTYVLTLDALWRFTETGKEFGVDMLSKHTMHSDVSIYIAFSGEFFIRRVKHPKQPPPPEPIESSSQSHPPPHSANASHPPDSSLPSGPPNDDPPKEPYYYQLVIDNDSGTYRPNADLLPKLKSFLARSLPGIHILTLDCQADAEKMGKMKQEQRDRKKAEGNRIVYMQRRGSANSSLSSSDEEDLDALQAGLDIDDEEIGGQDGTTSNGIKRAVAEAKFKGKSKVGKVGRHYGLKGPSATSTTAESGGTAVGHVRRTGPKNEFKGSEAGGDGSGGNGYTGNTSGDASGSGGGSAGGADGGGGGGGGSGGM